MRTRVVSLRLSLATAAALERSAEDARSSVAGALDWLLRNSFGNCELLRGLGDCAERPNVKLDARLSEDTVNSLKNTAAQLNISPSVYIRRLLYHLFVMKRLKYVQFNGRYTLAYRP
jgi:hypothetical protein